jgi:hypothetical protein
MEKYGTQPHDPDGEAERAARELLSKIPVEKRQQILIDLETIARTAEDQADAKERQEKENNL